MDMIKNIGLRDRIIRLIIGIALFYSIILIESKILQWFILASSIFCIFEAIRGWCLMYSILGKNTCPVAKKE